MSRTTIEWVARPGTIPESWRTVPGYADYEISDKGRLKSHRRGESRILKPIYKSEGHSYVFLYGEPGKSEKIYIHRAVLSAFRGLPQPNQESRHLDGDPRNNHLDNLVWGTRQENVNDRRRHGRMPIPHESKFTKLKPENIPPIRELQGQSSSRRVAATFGTSHTTILKIWRGERWKGY